MKLFRRRTSPPEKADETVPPAAVAPPEPLPIPEPPCQISLSAEQKSILEKPVDPRVDRILNEIYADKAAAELALTSTRRIISFPHSDSGERHVIQDENGLWRIMPGHVTEQTISMLEAL